MAHSRGFLFRALRPVLVLAMDCAVCHLTAFTAGGNFGADQQKEKPSIISRYLLKSIKLRSMLYLESVVKSLGELPNSVEHSQALKKFCRWLEAVSTGWLQLSRHRFGRPLATTNDTAINPVWASSLRPDVVGFTCGSSPLSKGHCATFPIVSNKAIYDDDDNE